MTKDNLWKCSTRKQALCPECRKEVIRTMPGFETRFSKPGHFIISKIHVHKNEEQCVEFLGEVEIGGKECDDIMCKHFKL